MMETKEIYEFGPFRADVLRKTLTRSGQPVPLPPKAFDVLYALLQKPGRTVVKDELMKQVWPDTFVEEGNLAQMVSLLRKALGETEGAPSLIVTVPRQGYRFVGDLTGVATGSGKASAAADGQAPVSAGRAGLTRLWWIGATIGVLSGFGGWLIGRYRVSESLTEARILRYTIPPPESASYLVARVSPDGRSVALMAADTSGKARLWVRRLDTLAAQSLAAAEFWPFWSPDSRFIAFAQNGKLKRIEASGGAPQTICDAALVIGGSWGRKGTIIFSNGDVIYRVPASGGEAKALTRLDGSRGETTHNFPVFLPDGSHFLYTIHSTKRNVGGIYVGSIDSPDARTRLLGDISNVEYAPGSSPGTGHLLFVRGGVLMAQRFAARNLQLKSEAVPVMQMVMQNPVNSSASFSASENVLLVTSTYPGDQLTWFDRTGRVLGTLGRAGLHQYAQLSPDEQTVAADNTDAESFLTDVWLLPVTRGTPSRLTFRGAIRGIWSPDGVRIAFESLNTAFYAKSIAGADDQALLLEAMKVLSGYDDRRLPCEWSQDGRFLVYSQWDTNTGFDVWKLPMFGDRKPVSLLHTEFNEWCGTLSPDGKWIAYASDESGRSEIYVQAFSAEGALSQRKWLISNEGGHWPKWRRDGKELLYLAADRGIMAVDVTTGTTFRHGSPKFLFASGIRTPDARFDVTKDGRRFIIPASPTEADSEPARVIINWTRAIKP